MREIELLIQAAAFVVVEIVAIFHSILWDDDDDPDGNIQHLDEHGLTVDDVD